MAEDAASLAARLRPYRPVMFGLDAGCAHTAAMKAAWGRELVTAFNYIACDASDAAGAVCGRAGVTRTPTLAFGGVQFPGFVPLPKVRELLDAADGVGEALSGAGAVLYTRPDCRPCEVQKALLGPQLGRVEVVDCVASEERCDAAGVSIVPTWQMHAATATAASTAARGASGGRPALGPLIPGVRVLPELRAMALADAGTQAAMAEAAAGGSVPGRLGK